MKKLGVWLVILLVLGIGLFGGIFTQQVIAGDDPSDGPIWEDGGPIWEDDYSITG